MHGVVEAKSWEDNENTPNSLGRREKTAENLRTLGGPGAIKSAIAVAAKLSGLTYTRTFDLWYRKAKRVEPFEFDQIVAALERKQRLDARQEFAELRSRMARLESFLTQTDPDFHRETIDRVRAARRGE